MISRFVIGLAGGVVFPTCHAMVGKWSPPDEKSRFVWSLLGGTFGTILSYPFIASIAENINWQAAWYIPSLIMIVWVILWWFLAYDSPDEHPRITEVEKNYIITLVFIHRNCEHAISITFFKIYTKKRTE